MKPIYDPLLGKMRTELTAGAGLDISGGTISTITPPDGVPYVAGDGVAIDGATIYADLTGLDRIEVDGGTITYNPLADIVTVSGSAVTLNPDTAYKIQATTQAVTLNANVPASGKWGLDGHAEIFVAGTGYVVTGANVVLATPLEPDAVNNCTLRFHDGLCIISVEDHVAGYIVVSATGTTAGSLPYGISSASQEYIAFDASLNGTTIDLSGSTASGEKHIVGNSYADTILTGTVDCGTSKFTVANLSLQDVVVGGGTMTLGDAYIPSGSTVAVSGGGLAIEKVTGAGSESVINLNGGETPASPALCKCYGGIVSNVTITNGNAVYGGGINITGGTTVISDAVISGCHAGIEGAGGSGGGAGIYAANAVVSANNTLFTSNTTQGSFPGGVLMLNTGSAFFSSCTFTDNSNPNGAFYLAGTASCTFTDCNIGDQSINLNGTSCKAFFSGTNIDKRTVIGTGSVTLTSGAILDLIGNTNATPIAPGGWITFEAGGATVLYGEVGSVSSMYIAGATVATIASGGTATISGDMNYFNGAEFVSATLSGGRYLPGYVSGGSATIKLIDCGVATSVFMQTNLPGRVEIGGTCTFDGVQLGNTQATRIGTVIINDNTTIITNFSYLTQYAGTIEVGSNCTINGNAIESGTHTNCRLTANGSFVAAE